MKLSISIYLTILVVYSNLTSCQTNNSENKTDEGKYQTELYDKNSDDSDMNLLIKEAEDFFNKGKYHEAIKKFEESDSVYGVNSTSLSDKALCYTKLGDYKKSLEFNSEYIEKYEDDPVGWSNRGMIYIRLDKYDLALADFNKSVELDPKEAAFYYNRYFAYENLNNRTKACEDLKKALELGFTKKYGSDALDRYNRFCK